MTDSRHHSRGPVPRRNLLLPWLALVAAGVATALGLAGTPNALDLLVEALPFDRLPPSALGALGALTDLGAPKASMALTVLGCALLLLLRCRAAAGWLFAVTAGAATLFPLLKRLFALPRPSAPLVVVSGYGLPSGHALVSTVMWGYLAWILFRRGRPAAWRRIGLTLCAALPIAIGSSRVVLGAHWLSDVVAGWLYGLACLGLVLWLETRPAPGSPVERSAARTA